MRFKSLKFFSPKILRSFLLVEAAQSARDSYCCILLGGGWPIFILLGGGWPIFILLGGGWPIFILLGGGWSIFIPTTKVVWLCQHAAPAAIPGIRTKMHKLEIFLESVMQAPPPSPPPPHFSQAIYSFFFFI